MPLIKSFKPTRRIKILTELEQQLYYQSLYFDDADRNHFFMINNEERRLIQNTSPIVFIYSILQMGYFKAKQQFFQGENPTIEADWLWILHHYFPSSNFSYKLPSRNIQSEIKHKIATFFGYQIDRAVIKKYLEGQADYLIQQCNDPIITFKELFLHLKEKKMVLLGYTTMQDIISKAYTKEETRILNLIEQHLTTDIKNQLNSLLGTEDKLNSIRDLKTDLSGFNYAAMKKEIHLHQSNQTLYYFSKNILPRLQLSEQNIHYYADCINYYSTYELKRMPKLKYYLYLLCYLYYRHQKMNNNLIQAFIYHVDKIKKSGSIHASKTISQQQKTVFADPETMGLLIGNYANEPLLKSRKLFKAVAEEVHQMVSKETIKMISQQMLNQPNYQIELEWQYYHEHRQLMELNLRQIFKALTFQADKMEHPIIEAVTFLKNLFDKNIPITKVPSVKFPQRVIPKKLKGIIVGSDGKVRPHHYEFLIYYKLKDYLVKNIIYNNDSVQYKSFSEDTKITMLNGESKETLLKKIDRPKLLIPIKDRLPELEREIEELFVEVNKNIASGKNKSIQIKKVKGETTWNLKYPPPEKEFNHKFYEKLPVVNISDIFDFVNEQCHFMDEFKHFRVKNVKGEIEYQAIKADLIAEGTRQSLHKMADRSNLNFETLRRNKQNYIREKTIKAACKKIIKEMGNLSITKRYLIQGKHFASIDGSKKGTAKKIAASRHSPKYFGLDRGLSVMNMIMDNIIVNSDYISCNEYEGHNIYDLYFNHDADFDPDTIAMDTHGLRNHCNSYKSVAA